MPGGLRRTWRPGRVQTLQKKSEVAQVSKKANSKIITPPMKAPGEKAPGGIGNLGPYGRKPGG